MNKQEFYDEFFMMKDYIEYINAKIEIGEVPMNFNAWQEIEMGSRYMEPKIDPKDVIIRNNYLNYVQDCVNNSEVPLLFIEWRDRTYQF